MPKAVRTIRLSERSVAFDNGTVVEAPGLTGEVTQWSGSYPGFRGAMYPGERDLDPKFETALSEIGIDVQETIHLDVQQAAPALRGAVRAQPKADTVTIVPAPPKRAGVQIILFQDESGGLSWHFPDGFLEGNPRRAPLRKAKQARFTIPARTSDARGSTAGPTRFGLRGPLTKLGRKVFKVLVVPISKVLAKPVEAIVGKVEQKYRQELIRSVTAENYRQHVTTPFDAWDSIAGKRSLLIVHGILSTTEGMLSRMPKSAMESLVQAYGGRVLALDQLTVTRDPEENAVRFLRAIAQAGGPFEFDILCHSRGGIVARTLAERGKALVPKAKCSFRRVFFVATPNAGSRLADADHIVDMLDVFTNWSTNFPDGPVSYSIEILLSIIKLVAHTAAARLPGVAAMSTTGYIPDVLNKGAAPSTATYGAAASNYEPDPSRDNAFFTGRFANWIIDRVFQDAANDLVVPRDGVFAANGHPSFPIQEPVVFRPDDAVWHTDFFSRQATVDRILSFFAEQAPLRMPPQLRRRSGGYDWAGAVSSGRLTTASMSAPPSGGESRSPRRAPIRKVRPKSAKKRAGAPPRKKYSMGDGPEISGLRRRAAGGGVSPPIVSAMRIAAAPTRVAKPPAAEKLLERKPEIRFHELVFAGETNELNVGLEDVLLKGAAGNIQFKLDSGEEQADITVSIHAPGFIVDRESAKLVVRSSRDPALEKAKFNLTARDLGPVPVRREINADFWFHNALVGAVTHYTMVVPKGYSGPTSGDGRSKFDTFVLRPGKREECDLIVKVEGESEVGQPPFRLRGRSTIPTNEYESKDFGRLNLPAGDIGTYVQSAIESQIATYPEVTKLTIKRAEAEIAKWNHTFILRLRDLGKQLWGFLPQSFRDEYFAFYATGTLPRSILIHSDEMLFPWELAIPNQKVGGRFTELEPLGVLHVLGRWRPGMKMRPPAQQMMGHAFVLLRPQYSGQDHLPWAEKEEANILKLLPGVEVPRPLDSAVVRRKLLNRNDVRIVHFSGHGEFDPKNADLSSLLLEQNTTLNAMSLANTKLGAEGEPILYLNACSVGAAAITVGRAGGFAASCVEGGYSGVIAPYWAVNDASAASFSALFYERINRGQSIGEALRELRDANRDDPTFFAFAYFGDPWTRIDLSQLTAQPRSRANAGRRSTSSGRAHEKRPPPTSRRDVLPTDD